jgi:hypothetical protein
MPTNLIAVKKKRVFSDTYYCNALAVSTTGVRVLDHFPGKGQTLTALGLAAELGKGGLGAGFASDARGFTHIPFPQRIAHTDDHG